MSFEGPLFILGSPRSGTKLVRDTLNQSVEVSIPIHETKFIPKILEICCSKKSDPTSLAEIIKNSEFYEAHLKEGCDYKLDNLILDSSDPGDILKSIAKESDRSRGIEDRRIWGDKSPFMELKLEILARSFPSAKYIFVIRDPRDVYSSLKKMYPWRSVTRFSFLWEKSSKNALGGKIIEKERVLVVRYEDFIMNTIESMNEICDFLNIQMTEKMSAPNRITEYSGDAKGRDTVMRHNSGKFKSKLSNKEIKIIESICSEAMLMHGYENIHTHLTIFKPSKSRIKFLQLRDYVLELPSLIAKYGIVSGAARIINKLRLRY